MTKEDIHGIVGELERDGSIGNDNRAGFPGQLHRLSVMRDKVHASSLSTLSPVFGFTELVAQIRVGLSAQSN